MLYEPSSKSIRGGEELKKYIGFKMVEAEPMTDVEFSIAVRPLIMAEGEEPCDGYKIVSCNGYVSWMPKSIFEDTYMQVGSNNTVTQELVDDFIVDYEVFTKQDKITIVIATLRNNFTIVESSACVDPANYSEKLGADICKERIKSKVWNHLGFLLQTAKDGVKR